MLKTNREIADMLGITDENLRFHLKKPDAPEAKLRMVKRRIVKYYDVEDIKSWWGSK